MPDALPPAEALAWLPAVDLTWQPIVARDQRPIGVRIDIALRDREQPVPTVQLLNAVLAGCTAGDAAPFPRGLVLLAPRGLALDDSLVDLLTPRNVLLEVAARSLAADDVVARLAEVQRRGVRLVLRQDTQPPEAGRSLSFQYVVTAAAQAATLPAGSGVLVLDGQTRAQAQAAFDAGAHAVIGWPVDEPVPEAPGSLQPMQKAVLELIRLLQSEADPPDIERGFQAEPVMTYLLLTLANTPAFRRGANIASITQAITLLGYKRLLKWLVLLLVIASKGSRALPQIHTAVVRGFAMENLAAALGVGALRDEAFVAGAFSLLNRITGLEFDSLFGDVALPDAVVAAVTRGEGPLGELLQQARALESPARQGPALAAAEQRNTALLQAIAAADALQSLV